MQGLSGHILSSMASILRWLHPVQGKRAPWLACSCASAAMLASSTGSFSSEYSPVDMGSRGVLWHDSPSLRAQRQVGLGGCKQPRWSAGTATNAGRER